MMHDVRHVSVVELPYINVADIPKFIPKFSCKFNVLLQLKFFSQILKRNRSEIPANTVDWLSRNSFFQNFE